MEYRLSHTTRCTYARPVETSHQLLHLTPRSFEKQKVSSATVVVEPKPVTMRQRVDYFDNIVTDVEIRARHSELVIRSDARVNVRSDQEILLDLSPPWEHVGEIVRIPTTRDAWDAARFTFPSTQVSLAEARLNATGLMTPGKPFLRMVMELTQHIYEEFEYQGGVTDVYTPVPEILAARRGVCQDFAHVGIACLRAYGLPARYISGFSTAR